MVVVLGLVLLGLTLYMSTLAYALRDYWRSELSERVGRNGPRRWLDWLERHESELQLATGFTRLVGILGFLMCAYTWAVPAEARPGSWVVLTAPALTALVLLAIFGIGIPHTLAFHAGEVILSRSLWVLLFLRTALWPVTCVLLGMGNLVRRAIGSNGAVEESELMEQEILEAVSEGEAAGAVAEEQKEIIESVFRLDDTPISAIMTPRTDINAVPVHTTYDEVRDRILLGGHSRIPVYEGSIDHIIGVVYAKDLLRLNAGEPFDARRIMRAAPYVPETKAVSKLLEDFRRTKVQIAIVLDEYGGTAGLVTIEDVLEELVGEIADEYDQAPPPAIHRIDEHTLEVDGRVHVDEINEELGIHLPDEQDYDTIGGFVFSTLGKIPTVGEEFEHEQVHFRVMDAEPRRINRLRITVQREKAELT